MYIHIYAIDGGRGCWRTEGRKLAGWRCRRRVARERMRSRLGPDCTAGWFNVTRGHWPELERIHPSVHREVATPLVYEDPCNQPSDDSLSSTQPRPSPRSCVAPQPPPRPQHYHYQSPPLSPPPPVSAPIPAVATHGGGRVHEGSIVARDNHYPPLANHLGGPTESPRGLTWRGSARLVFALLRFDAWRCRGTSDKAWPGRMADRERERGRLRPWRATRVETRRSFIIHRWLNGNGRAGGRF